ncbi:MAG: GatB/YqeY domain-containing protein [Chloroflexota bacterium]
MELRQRLQADTAAAMKAGDLVRRDTLRLVLAAIKQSEVDGGRPLNEADVQAVLTRQIKQRRESVADYERAGRPDLAAKEQAELQIIESYLPQMMSREEIATLARQVIGEMDIKDAKGMGQVMSKLMPQVKGKADGRLVNEVVREMLQ